MTAKASSVRRGRNRHDRRGLWPVRHLRAGARHLPVAARPGPEVPAAAGTRPTTHGSLSGLVGRVARASALAQVLGQLVSFLQTIALARLLTPTDIGIFTAGTALTGLLVTFVEGGLRAGLVQRQGNLADADETVFWVTLMTGAAASLGCLAAAPVIGIIFHSHVAGLVAAATAGVLLIHSLTNVPESVLQREFSIKRRLIVGPAIAVSYAVVAVGLAALGCGVWSMVAGTYASFIAWVVSVWMLTSWRPGRGHASFAMWRELARFGFPLVLGTTGYRLRTAVEALVVGRVLSTSALGFFRYGQRIALIAEMGIIEVGETSLFPAFSRIAGGRERFAAAYLRALHWSMVAAAAGTGLMIAAGEPAVVVLLGERWRGAGVALVAMSGLSIGSAISVVVQEAIKAHGRTRLINWFTLADLSIGVGFLLVLIRPFGFVGASLYISLTSLVSAAIILGLAQLVVTVPLRRVLTVLATPLPGLLVATVAAWWLEHDLLRADSRGPILAVVLLAVDALVFCLLYLAVLTVFARSTVVKIVRIVPVLIARVRRGALADTTTSPRMGHIGSDTSAPRPATGRCPRRPGPAAGPGSGGRMIEVPEQNIEVPEPNTTAVIASLNPRPKKTALNRTAHTATFAPKDGGFLVTCPDGCNLGTSAHQPDQRAAEGRAELHRLATAPLIPDTDTTR
jgi:O-antigen/teichoic acid export membrane protein